ncbi:TPA: GspH/FimT family pseudopilin [Aeromonas dhakensis]|nr:GspH/FimT family pseudopilin [Aeromonas dhakensis]
MFLRSGFSLIELMVTIALVSILLTLGVPSFSAIMRNMTLTSQANNFVAAINLARSEAIRRNTAVTLSASTSNLTQNHWESGWQIWVDRNISWDDGAQTLLFSALYGITLVSGSGVLRFTAAACSAEVIPKGISSVSNSLPAVVGGGDIRVNGIA